MRTGVVVRVAPGVLVVASGSGFLVAAGIVASPGHTASAVSSTEKTMNKVTGGWLSGL